MIEIHYDIVLDLYERYVTPNWGNRNDFCKYALEKHNVCEHDAVLLWQGFDMVFDRTGILWNGGNTLTANSYSDLVMRSVKEQEIIDDKNTKSG